MADVDLRQALTSFARSAWRLEALDAYTSPGEAAAIEAWRAGEHPRNEGWLRILTEHVVAGHDVGRVHAIGRLTDYLRFELATYAANAAEGEIIGVADRNLHPELAVDFWIFDDRRVAVMHYDEAGRFVRATDGTHDLARYRHLRDVALAAAVPLADWTATVAQRS